MNCYICSSPTRVGNSRATSQDHLVWRRRTCSHGHTFTTYESPDYSTLRVLKRSGVSEPFNRDKLFMSLWQSLDSLESAGHLTKTVITNLLKLNQNQISAQDVHHEALVVLRRFDAKASQRYDAYADQ